MKKKKKKIRIYDLERGFKTLFKMMKKSPFEKKYKR